MRNIYIIGSGAIGKTLAVCLQRAHGNVVLLRGSVDDGSTSVDNLQVQLHDGTILEAAITISSLSCYPVLDGIIVLANKSYGNAALALALKGRTGNSPVVILQNGLNVEDVFIDRGFPHVYRCVLFVTSQAIAANRVRFKPVSVCPIGIVKGDERNLDELTALLDSPHFRFRTELDIQAISWRKAIINSVFNSVCPLLNVDNGIFYRDEEAVAIAKRVIAECVSVANFSGVTLSEGGVLEGLLAISKASEGQLISTLQDINNKRPTEIDTLNFEIVRMAEKLNRGNLVSETRLLGELTAIKSLLNR